ncbi:MAG TPA: xanthine dehydrogenase family protein molybdopterin-binding subunit [Xanthobacteraceae bacterium]|nr:xanthine dehydrogenase family protein molybdopterin-binding subunit [Xanthobacteraceae bacterium]
MDTKTDSHAHHPRVEDDYLVRGNGRFIADAAEPNEATAVFVRSPHAHARIRGINVDAAKKVRGVIAIVTAADVDAAGVGSVTRHPPLPGRNGGKLVMPHRHALARERVMYVGETVAMVIAETAFAAQDAAELVEVDYEPLDPVVTIDAARAPDAQQLWPEAPGNVALDWAGTHPNSDANAAAVERIFATAKHVARVKVTQQRLTHATMEPRGATARYDSNSGGYHLRVCSQSAGAMRDNVIQVMNLPKEKLRVITEDVGGAFGMKTGAYPEYIAQLVGAKVTKRPVHWMATRSESFLNDAHARDTITEAELALDDNGRFLALRVRHFANLGGYVGSVGANLQTLNFARCFPSMYDIRSIDVGVKCLFTNTAPTSPYRGAGRPEANYVLERVIDEAARVTGIDRIRLRKKNLIPAKAIPYKTAVGTTYDSGEFPVVFEKALALADVDGFKKRRKEALKRGKLRGLGISCVLEHSGGAPLEGAALKFPGGDGLTLVLNVQSTGQGHQTVFPRVVAERLGIAAAQVVHQHGDSANEIPGFASVASRSAITAGGAMVKTIDTMLAKGKTIAAQVLEAAEADIAYKDGRFEVVGTDRRISLFDLASRAKEMKGRGEIADDLDTKTTAETPQAFPNGVHVAEVEIDRDTGQMTVASYTAVDDSGNILDHMIVEGQFHGALAQGLGQAIGEHVVYDPDGGQLLSGSFMDYQMPRAVDMPVIRDQMHIVPATTNPLGVKGVGEAATTGAIATVMSAVDDAIAGAPGALMEMPATAEKLWKAIRAHGA